MQAVKGRSGEGPCRVSLYKYTGEGRCAMVPAISGLRKYYAQRRQV